MTGAQRVARRRAALRAQGLRPKTFWLPDATSDTFMEQARRDCERAWQLLANDEEAIAFAEVMTDEILRDLPDYPD